MTAFQSSPAATPARPIDPVIEAYKKDVDRTLLRENLKLTAEERLKRFESFMLYVYELRDAGKRMRASSNDRSA